MSSYLEHANITVRNLDEAIQFIQTALPDFKVRDRSIIDGRDWAHVGTDTSYLALVQGLDSREATKGPPTRNVDMGSAGFNHLGFVVDDLHGVLNRLRSKGYARGFNDGDVIEHPHRRSAYILDNDGNEYEFMQYLTDDPAERNQYES